MATSVIAIKELLSEEPLMGDIVTIDTAFIHEVSAIPHPTLILQILSDFS